MLNRLTILALFAPIILMSCATATKIIGPDGTEHQLIHCNAIEDCYTKATEVCGGKYKIANTSTQTSGANGYTDTSTKLLVKCDK